MRNRGIRDKKCLYCPKLILRISTSCKVCWQKGEKCRNWKGGMPSCISCGKQKRFHTKGLCADCFRGENHFAWKDNPGYGSLHDWVRSRLGLPSVCIKDNSHKAKRYVWANKSGNYKRDLSDWWSLCNSCNLTDGIRIPERLAYVQ